MKLLANDNRIISAHQAVINGRKTGLAGCSSAGTCALAETCLRANPRLEYRVQFSKYEACTKFIKA